MHHLIARALMIRVQDAVHDRVAHVHVRRRHIDLGAQHARPVGEFAVLHALEQIEIFLNRSVAVRAFFAGLGQRAAILADLVRAQIIDIGFAVS